jgi:hypothetical protein
MIVVILKIFNPVLILKKNIKMKKLNYLIIFLISLSLFFSCKKEDNSHDSNSSASNSSVLTSGSWRVSYYHHDSDDNTADFSGYVFIFTSAGTMSASNSNGTTTGTWSQDDSHNELHFSIGSSTPLNKLSSGWAVISSNGSEMLLKDDGNSAEEVHFSKI